MQITVDQSHRPEPALPPQHDAAAFAARLAAASPREIIEAAVEALPDRLAVVSSFGAESAVLLKFVADVDPSLPVLFLDTLWLLRRRWSIATRWSSGSSSPTCAPPRRRR